MFRNHSSSNLRNQEIFHDLLFRQMLTKDSPIVTNYLKGYCNKDDCTFVFIKKIVQEKEIKLK